MYYPHNLPIKFPFGTNDEMKKLDGFHPQRRRLQFDLIRQQSSDTFSDEFFEYHFSSLIIEVYTLAQTAFCPKEEANSPESSPWRQKYSKELLKYVNLVARPDPVAGNWERLLHNSSERAHLLQAVIMKVLDTQVLSNLLFGADPHYRNSLKSTDASLINAEGFERSILRARANGTYLKMKHGTPPVFWQEVDRLSTQILVLLLPIYTWCRKSKGWQPPAIQDLCQWIHNIVAYAGWINICVRLSSAIISFDWVLPGERYHVGHINLSYKIYKDSFNLAKVLQRKQQTDPRIPASSRKMVARVKISAVPKIVRHKLIVNEHGKEGMETYTITHPQVVYYHGHYRDYEDDDKYVSLPDYIQQLRHRTSPFVWAMLALAVVLLWIMLEKSEDFHTDAW